MTSWPPLCAWRLMGEGWKGHKGRAGDARDLSGGCSEQSSQLDPDCGPVCSSPLLSRPPSLWLFTRASVN